MKVEGEADLRAEPAATGAKILRASIIFSGLERSDSIKGTGLRGEPGNRRNRA